MNELTLNIQQNPGVIDFNFDELEKALDNKLKQYKGAVFTEESKGIAKKEVAELRKLKADLDKARKGVKTEWMKPFNQFEERMKALIGKVDEPIMLIDEQVKAFDRMQKEKKKKKIEEIYKQLVDDELAVFLSLEAIYNPKWENATVSDKAVRTDMSARMDVVRSQLQTINGMVSDVKEEAREIYKKTLDVTAAITHINQYEQNKAKALEIERHRQEEEASRKYQMELERVRAEERVLMEREARIRAEATQKSVEKAVVEIPEATEKTVLPFVQPNTKTVFYRVVATKDELEQVEMAFNSIGIFFERRDS